MKTTLWTAALMAAVVAVGVAPARAQTAKPNILVVWGDDVGQSNISA